MEKLEQKLDTLWANLDIENRTKETIDELIREILDIAATIKTMAYTPTSQPEIFRKYTTINTLIHAKFELLWYQEHKDAMW